MLVTVISASGIGAERRGHADGREQDTVDGTIGGGHLEFSAIGIARDMLAARGAPAFEQRRSARCEPGSGCGGLVNLLFEPVGADAAWVDALATLRRGGTAAVVATPRTAPEAA